MPSDRPAPLGGPDWLCGKCHWTNAGRRGICRNCGAFKSATPTKIQGECLSCAITGTRSRLQPARTARGLVDLCTTCGDEWTDVDENGRAGGELRRVHTNRQFVPGV